jgi:putative ubiquitin-RnfH superfamily antitoxin RatB of RatAB toxin-antitoxin module
MKVTVVLALPARQHVVELELAEGATVGAAIEGSGLRAREPGLDLEALATGIWGRACGRGAVLREGDRVELYRPIEADAREMRRSRVRLKPSSRSRSGP